MLIFEAPIREFRTKRAAEKFAARISGAVVRPSTKSAFDMYHPEGKRIYQVFTNA